MSDKQITKQNAAALLGLADPLIRQLAQKIALSVPADSVTRTTAFESTFGAIKGWLEAHAEKYPALISALVEKATDFEDFLTVAIAESKGQQHGVSSIDSFLEEAGARLKSANDPSQEFERIKIELEFREKLAEMLRAKTGVGTEQTGTKAKDWIEKQAVALTPAVNSLNQKLEKIRNNLRNKKGSTK